MSPIDLIWLFFLLSAVQPVLKQRFLDKVFGVRVSARPLRQAPGGPSLQRGNITSQQTIQRRTFARLVTGKELLRRFRFGCTGSVPSALRFVRHFRIYVATVREVYTLPPYSVLSC